jgi:hypothetical protein
VNKGEQVLTGCGIIWSGEVKNKIAYWSIAVKVHETSKIS